MIRMRLDFFDLQLFINIVDTGSLTKGAERSSISLQAASERIKKLEQQLLMFPRSALWDLMDAEAYIIEMLELGERYFSPKEDPDDIESEFSELDYEKPIEAWRYMS